MIVRKIKITKPKKANKKYHDISWQSLQGKAVCYDIKTGKIYVRDIPSLN